MSKVCIGGLGIMEVVSLKEIPQPCRCRGTHEDHGTVYTVYQSLQNDKFYAIRRDKQ
jgi:hypothetical protein